MTIKTPKMESAPHKLPTYFVYETKEADQEFGEIIGPVFPEEIEDIKNEVFANKAIQIDSESIFKHLYYDAYRNTFRDYWFDFVARLLDSLEIPVDYHIDSTIGLNESDDFYDEAEEEAESSFLDKLLGDKRLFELGHEDEDEDDEIEGEVYSVISEYFTITKDINGLNHLYISFSIDFSPYWVGILTKELTLYLDGIFELEIGEPFYISTDGSVITGLANCYLERMKDTTRIQLN